VTPLLFVSEAQTDIVAAEMKISPAQNAQNGKWGALNRFDMSKSPFDPY